MLFRSQKRVLFDDDNPTSSKGNGAGILNRCGDRPGSIYATTALLPVRPIHFKFGERSGTHGKTLLGKISVQAILRENPRDYSPTNLMGAERAYRSNGFHTLNRRRITSRCTNSVPVEPVAWLDFGLYVIGWLQLDLITAPPI